MEMETDKCVICSSDCLCTPWGYSDVRHYACRKCGEFEATREAHDDVLRSLGQVNRARLSACTRERNVHGLPHLILCIGEPPTGAPVGACDVHYVLDSVFPRRVHQRLDRALLNLSMMTGTPGEKLSLSREADSSAIMAESDDTADFILDELCDLGHIKFDASNTDWFVTVRAAGMERVAEMEDASARERSEQAFVAMWFSADTETAWLEAIRPAAEACGFLPFRVDNKETNNKICDEIVAEIRRSRFVIADFTGHRGGVYFEAGYAMGLGIPVIWTCQSDDLEKLHFDTRQYSHVTWSDAAELRGKLTKRIAATIPGARLPRD